MDEPMELGKQAKMPKASKVKNKTPAAMQITAEQLLREAKERELELVHPPPKQKIADSEELKMYRMRKRKGFEDEIRKNRTVMTNWMKYASWEEGQKEIQRCRSVYERALDIDHRNITVWLKYAEMEMRARQVNHARNIWDRAIMLLPRANQFWYKYTYMEELLKNIPGARQIFERWMEWEPEEQAWRSYVNFEMRYKELDRARHIYERFVQIHATPTNWVKYAKFEERAGYLNSARRIYERAVEFFGEDNVDESLFVAFAKFEEKNREHDRARAIYQHALHHLPKERCNILYRQYIIHEKKFGDRLAIENVVTSKRRYKYEQEVKENPNNYDAWFDYIRLMESDADVSKTRDVYERAISNIPPSKEKRHWRRYIYLWINYAIYEELEAPEIEYEEKDVTVGRVRAVYDACLQIIPHKKFTFAKIWLMYSHFEIRQHELGRARKILGTALGKCATEKLFRGYIETEIQLRQFERCRILYDKLLTFSPQNCGNWIKYCELETILGDDDRARAIYELAITQPRLDMPEVLWKSYIDFELEAERFDRVRDLYDRLLERTQHVKVWISLAQFELSVGVGGGDSGDKDEFSICRSVYKKANQALKLNDCTKDERVMLLQAWSTFEQEHGSEENQEVVKKMLPDRVKRRRKIQTELGDDAGWEEYYDYIFPDDDTSKPNLRLLAMAKQWKQHRDGDSDSDSQDEDSDAADDSDSDTRPEETASPSNDSVQPPCETTLTSRLEDEEEGRTSGGEKTGSGAMDDCQDGGVGEQGDTKDLRSTREDMEEESLRSKRLEDTNLDSERKESKCNKNKETDTCGTKREAAKQSKDNTTSCKKSRRRSVSSSSSSSSSSGSSSSSSSSSGSSSGSSSSSEDSD